MFIFCARWSLSITRYGGACRVEMSLRSPKKGGSAASAVAAAASVAEIPVGAVLPGFVRRVEAFGVFVEVCSIARRCLLGL